MGRGRDQIDVLGADALQFQHSRRQGFRREGLTDLAGLKHFVLTEYAPKIAAGEKDGPRTAVPADAGFLIAVQPDPGDAHGIVAAAEAALHVPVYMAETGTKVAAHGRLPQTKLRSQ